MKRRENFVKTDSVCAVHIWRGAVPVLMLAVLSILGSLSCKGSDVVLGVDGEKHSSFGFYIKDLAADTMVFESDADRALIPASIMKSLTSATAMSVLPADFRFKTKVLLEGKKDGERFSGNIVVHSAGDPTVNSEHMKDADLLGKVVGKIKELGISCLEGQIKLIRVNPSRDYTEGPLAGWEIDDTPWGYGAGVFDFNFRDNTVTLPVAAAKPQQAVKGVDITVKYNGFQNYDLVRGVYADSLIVFDKNLKGAKAKPRNVYTSMPYPFDFFKQALVAALEKKGIRFVEKAVEAQSKERIVLIEHESQPLDVILKSLMTRSDNMFAEAMLLALGNEYGNRPGAIKEELALWKKRGLETDYVQISDGSGLARSNRVSPRFMGRMLEWMANSEMAGRYINLFPVAGVSGTMKNFMKDTPLKGRLAMKTGSMNGVQTYAGYLLDTDCKPTHIVVFMANSFFCPRQTLKTALAEFLLEKLNTQIIPSEDGK